MITEFAPLFTLAVRHDYYDGPCPGLGFVIPAETRQLLDGNRLRARSQGGALQIFYEKSADLPRATGITLRVGLTCTAPGFAAVTQLPFSPGSGLNLYRNTGSTLDPPRQALWGGRLLTHPLARAERPVTVTLDGPAGETLALQAVATDPPAEAAFDLTGAAPGLYRVAEAAAGGSRATDYYVDPELWSELLFAVAEITIGDGFYSTPPTLMLALAARSEPLAYYVVADGYKAGDPLPLLISDEGGAEQQRDTITFGPATGDPKLLNALTQGKEIVVKVFQSVGTVPRTAAGRRKIKLKRNGETLIANLPQPGPGSTDSNVIVHISKG